MGTAQIVEPVKWTSSVVKVSDTELDLIISASIENNWHLYSQFTPEGGALPLVFTFKNQKGNYQLIGKTKEGKYKKSFNEIFEIEEYYFQTSAKFTQRIKILNPKLKTISLLADGQACIDGKCVQTEGNLVFNLPVSVYCFIPRFLKKSSQALLICFELSGYFHPTLASSWSTLPSVSLPLIFISLILNLSIVFQFHLELHCF